MITITGIFIIVVALFATTIKCQTPICYAGTGNPLVPFPCLNGNNHCSKFDNVRGCDMGCHQLIMVSNTGCDSTGNYCCCTGNLCNSSINNRISLLTIMLMLTCIMIIMILF